MMEWEDIICFLDVVLNYLTLQFGRCALGSFLVIVLIMGLRRICKNCIFLKGLFWSLLLITPFTGRLRFFYGENLSLGFVRMSWQWSNWYIGHFWVSRIYFAGMLGTGFILWNRRRKLNRFVKSMKTEEIEGTKIFMCEHRLTPFTTGVFFPKIVMPEIMLKEYEKEEIHTILLHEKMHIRLGHLLFDLVWDVLHVLMWVNPLFPVCLKYFKADLEDVCDRVAIRTGGGSGFEYGSLLLKSMKLLQSGEECAKPVFAFAGEEQFLQIRDRIKTVAGYTKYKRTAVICMVLVTGIFLAGLLFAVKEQSYARYCESDGIYIYDFSGKRLLLEDSRELREAVSYDDVLLYIKTQQLKKLLESRNIKENRYWICFGGYMKMPGFGGGWCSVFINEDMLEQEIIKESYGKSGNVFDRIYKNI